MKDFKPNTRYKVKDMFKLSTGYEFITNHDYTAVITVAGDGWSKGRTVNLYGFNFKAFEEVKNKKDHLPDWL